jgi:hypothetical protein
MMEIVDIISEWESVTGNKLSSEDRRILADFIESGCRKMCEVI